MSDAALGLITATIGGLCRKGILSVISQPSLPVTVRVCVRASKSLFVVDHWMKKSGKCIRALS